MGKKHIWQRWSWAVSVLTPRLKWSELIWFVGDELNSKIYKCLYQMTLCWTVSWGVTPSSCILEPVLESLFRTARSLQPDMAERQLWVFACKEPGGNGALELEREQRYSPLQFNMVYKTLCFLQQANVQPKNHPGLLLCPVHWCYKSTSDKEQSERTWAMDTQPF